MYRKLLLGAAAALGVVAIAALWPNDNPPPKPIPAAAVQPVSQPTPQPAPPREPGQLVFQRLVIETQGDRPQVCFAFGERLKDDVGYADYLRIQPPVQASVRVDGSRLCLGGLDYGRDYQVTLRAGLPAASGARTVADETVPVALGERMPMIAFADRGFILPRLNSAGVAIETVNVDRVKLTVVRVGDRILARNLAELRASRDRYDCESNWLTQGIGTVMWTGEMAVERRANERVVTAVPLGGALPERKPGAYVLLAKNADGTARSEDYYNRCAAQWVIDTDIALSVLTGADGLTVLARSLDTAKPLANTAVALVAVNNDELGRAQTDAQGRASFAPGLLRGQGGARPAAVMGYGSGGDFALLDLKRPAFDLSDRGVSGRDMPGRFDAYLYTERGIYRPGETVHAVALLRDQEARAVDDAPLTLIVKRPNGGEFRRYTPRSAAAGAFQLDLELPATASRGLWSMTAFVDPTGKPVGRVEFEVQDFVPQRLKVKATPAAPAIDAGKPLGLSLDGLFLYGAPARDLKGEANVHVVPDPNPFPAAKGYAFGLADDKFLDTHYQIEVPATDAQGRASVEIALADLKPSTRPLKAQIEAGLFEPGGRITSDTIVLPVRTAPHYIGVKPLFDGNRVREGADASFEVQPFDATGRPIPAERLEYEFHEELYSYDPYYLNGSWRYQSSVRLRLLTASSIAVGERPAAIKLPVKWGRYVLVVRDAASPGTATSVKFRAGWVASDENETPDTVEVAVDKGSYRPGERVRVNVKPPFAGELTLIVATDRIHELRQISVPEDGTTLEFDAKAEWGVGAYVLAALHRPVSAARKRDSVRAVGLAWAALDTSDRKRTVEITVPATARPRTRIDIPVAVSGAANETTWLTLAAADEGILQLTRFASPAPDTHYLGKRKLGLELRDDYAKLLDGNAGKPGTLRQGGDSLGGTGLAVVPTRTVALFHGPTALDARGRGTVSLDLPDFVGQLRLMAVAFGKTGIGHGEARLIVRDAVVADLALPRFLAPGDEGRMTLMLHNVEGPAGAYDVKLDADGAVALAEAAAAQYELAADGRRIETFRLAGRSEGVGTVRLALEGPNGVALKRDWQIAVRTPWLPITLEQTASQAPGESYTADARLLAPFVPGSASVAINYGLTRGIDVAGLLQSLYRYPYGCTEQTVSVALPLLYVDDPTLLAETATRPSRAGAGRADANVRNRVQQAIDALLDRQDTDGEIGLWRGGDHGDDWVSVYALDFLVRAKQRGYVVSDHALALGRGWLAGLIHKRPEPRVERYTSLADAQAYALLVLTQLKAADIGTLRYFHDTQLGQLSGSLAMAQLGAALAMVGERGRAASAFTGAEGTVEQRRWRYYDSPLRNLGGMIFAASEAGMTDRVERLTERLITEMRPVESLHTQEKVWLTLAAHAMAKDGAMRLSVGNLAAATAHARTLAPTLEDLARGYTVGNLGDRPLWRSVVLHGAPATPPPALSAGIAVTKTLYNLKGEKIDAATLQQNDRVIVVLEGRAERRTYQQLVVVDMLAAGLEIEAVVARNPKTELADQFPWIGKVSAPRMQERRDDRYVAAVDVNAPDPPYRFREVSSPMRTDEFRVAYIARAITVGAFAMPGVAVEDMYRPQATARTEAGRLSIASRP